MKAMAMLTLLFIALLTSFGYVPQDGASLNTPGDSNVVEVIAKGLTFEAPDTISSGWTTFRLKNESGTVHFAVVERLPEGIGVKDQQEEVAPLFQEGMDLLNEGKAEAAMDAFGKLPEWFGDVVFLGGPGLVSPGRTAEATVYLEPGTYMIECYVKTSGVFHSYNPDPGTYGMVHEFTVTEEKSDASAPSPTLEITLSSERGMEVDGAARPGQNTVAVHFADQKAYGNFVGHDVQLVRLEDDTDMEALAKWMDWTQPTGLETPAPAEFLGGTQEMPAGKTAYFTVNLTQGRYAWIAEVPNPDEKEMLKTFTVLPENGSGQ